MKTLYVFGDSHAWFGWKDLVLEEINVKAFELLPDSISCASFGAAKLNKLNILNYGVKDEDIVVFQFGETDCRRHLIKEKYVNRHEELIQKIVQNYFEAIRKNIEQLRNLTIIVASLYPIGNRLPDASDYRRNLHLCFNRNFKTMCEKYKYIFLNLYDVYLNTTTNTLNDNYSDRHVHITNPIFIKQELEKILYK